MKKPAVSRSAKPRLAPGTKKTFGVPKGAKSQGYRKGGKPETGAPKRTVDATSAQFSDHDTGAKPRRFTSSAFDTAKAGPRYKSGPVKRGYEADEISTGRRRPFVNGGSNGRPAFGARGPIGGRGGAPAGKNAAPGGRPFEKKAYRGASAAFEPADVPHARRRTAAKSNEAPPRRRAEFEGQEGAFPHKRPGSDAGKKRAFEKQGFHEESGSSGKTEVDFPRRRPFTPKAPLRVAAPVLPRGRGGKDTVARDFTDAPMLRTKGRAAGRSTQLDFDNLIYGVHAVDEALRAGETLLSLHIGTGRERDAAVAELIETAKLAGVKIVFESAAFYAAIPYKSHQSVIAIGRPFEYVSLEEAIEARETSRLIVVLDHLTDPHNVGAILRTAECAGAQALVLPDRRSAGINATVRKAAAGAASHMQIAKVGNLSQALSALKDAGFTVVGAGLSDEAIPYTDYDFTGDIALVIGAEGEGLGRLVARGCDALVKIPLMGKVESLNASVAAAVLLYEINRRRTHS